MLLNKFKITFVIFIIFFHSLASFAANYSNEAINTYNAGVALQKQGQYNQAESKYIQTLNLQPNFIEAKNNLGIVYQSLAYQCYSDKNYDTAVVYAKKSLSIKQNNAYLCEIMGRCYLNLCDYNNAITAFNKILSIEPNDTNAMEFLAISYIKTRQYDNAVNVYNGLLKINPNDKAAQQNLQYITYTKTESDLSSKINNTYTTAKAPNDVYKLIKPSPGITPATVEKMKHILDLVWSEPNGQILLQGLANRKVHINITQGTLNANASKIDQKHTYMLYGFIPIFSYDTSTIAVNIPFNFISNFYNPNLSTRERIYSLHAFVHEFGHAFMNVKNPNHNNALDEELGVSMIGYNTAYKVITGSYLTREQTKMYSMQSLESLLSDDHNKLPVYSGFNTTVQYYGLKLPYPDVYSDLVTMYKTLLAEKKVYPVQSFYQYMRCTSNKY